MRDCGAGGGVEARGADGRGHVCGGDGQGEWIWEWNSERSWEWESGEETPAAASGAEKVRGVGCGSLGASTFFTIP